MQGSVIRRMYAGFTLIIIMFAITVTIMMDSMRQIHQNFEGVTSSVLPLVSLSNQTSVQLLSADKSFKDFLTTQNVELMNQRRQEFTQAQSEFQLLIDKLAAASAQHSVLEERISALRELEQRYFNEAYLAMTNYQAMFDAQAKVQQSSKCSPSPY